MLSILRMKNFLLLFLFTANLLLQMNPAVCAGELLLVPVNGPAGEVVSKACCDSDADETDDHPGATDERCQCSCHLSFQAPLAPHAALPVYFFIPGPEYIRPHLPGVSGGILRPPRVS